MRITTFLSTIATFSAVFATPIPGDSKYMVVFKPGFTASDLEFHQMLLSRHDKYHVLHDSMKGFSFTEKDDEIFGYSAIIPEEIISAISSDPAIDYVEKDAPVHLYVEKDDIQTQHDATWGLSRASHREWPAKNDYIYRKTDGDDVTAYVVDTGIFIEHEDFEGRAKWGASFLDGNMALGKTDDNGHGTHVAGSVASKTYGLCKHCTVVAVQVLDGRGSGSMAGVVAGVEWVIKDHKRRVKENGGKPVKSTANMSLGGGYSRTLNRIVDAAVDSDVLFALAAGNESSDSCQTSPASAEKPITVGATDRNDNMASFSNYGECNDIFAPGHSIESLWNRKGAKNVISGTSMASPHVCGAMSVLWSRPEYSDYTATQIKELVIELATKNILNRIPTDLKTVNRLLFTDPEGKGAEKKADEVLVKQFGAYF